MRSFYDLMGIPPTGFDPDHRFVTSWLLPPTLLAATRLLFSIFCFAVTFINWGWYGTHHQVNEIYEEFSYFTNLTYWGITFYFLVAAVHGFVYIRHGQSWLDRWGRPLQVLHSFYYTTVVTMPVLVTIVYWVILFNGTWFPVTMDAFRNVSKHGLNSFFALFEILIPATNPPPFLHIPFLWLVLLLYLALAYLTKYTQNFYTYDFLDPQGGKRNGRVTAYVFGIMAAVLVIFLVVWGFIWIRRRITGAPKRSKRDSRAGHAGYEYSYARGNDVEMSVK